MDWTWFQVINSSTILFVIISLIWKVLFLPIAATTMVFNNTVQKFLMCLIVLIPYYFMASFSACYTLMASDEGKSISISIITGLFLFVFIGVGIVEASKRMNNDMDYEFEYLITARTIGSYLTIIYYIAVILFPQIVANKMNLKVVELMDWVQNIPILKWFIIGFSFMYTIYIIIIGSVMVLGMLVATFGGIAKLFTRK